MNLSLLSYPFSFCSLKKNISQKHDRKSVKESLTCRDLLCKAKNLKYNEIVVIQGYQPWYLVIYIEYISSIYTRYERERFRVQPGRIEDYRPGRCSVNEKVSFDTERLEFKPFDYITFETVAITILHLSISLMVHSAMETVVCKEFCQFRLNLPKKI